MTVNNYISYRAGNTQTFSFFNDEVTFPLIPIGAAVWRKFRGLPKHVPVIMGNYDLTPLETFDTNEPE